MEPDNGQPRRPPQLPPRQSYASSSLPSDDPPPYTSVADGHLQAEQHGDGEPWSLRDSRSSSTQSLAPSVLDEDDNRRRLLVVFIHGFMGNETSFRSFPAHVHRLLTVLLAETHVVHTKIYPRYRSKKKIGIARDNFSTWLTPHEAPTTDVVLLGHSMGGLLSSEVVLMPTSSPSGETSQLSSGSLKHRILGTINFDVPFLGMHPSVVKSGLASIFKSTEYEDQWSPEVGASTPTDASSLSSVPSLGSARVDTLWQPPAPDPNFNQRFANDVVLPVRKGWRNALHFVHKHSKSLNELGKATQQLVTSHLEFGGAMANYPELKTRYARIRALEDDNENVRRSGVQTGPAPPRVRFVNYYTVSTGRVKKPSPSPKKLSPSRNPSALSLQSSLGPEDARGRTGNETPRTEPARSQSPRISLEEYSEEGVVRKEPELPSSGDEDWEEAAETLTIGDRSESEAQVLRTASTNASLLTVDTNSSLRPLPELPEKPAELQPLPSLDAESRKLLEKEHARAVKAYDKAVKDRERTTRDRKKLEEKQTKKAERENSNPTGNSTDLPTAERTISSASTTLTPQTTTQTAPASSRSPSPSPSRARESQAPKREHTFCTLPPKDSKGMRDSTWIRVFMENVDEVGAHCGLFFVDERYERLVGDVADRIERWVHEDADRRFLAEHAVADLG